MSHIPYEGPSLSSRDHVTWAVQLWDEDDVPGEIAESWFEMGLLSATDWKAKWISGDYKPNKEFRQSVDCFKGEFTAHKTKYTPGKLEAVAYDASGREISRSALNSATDKLSISAIPEVKTAKVGEVLYVPVALVGENDVVESNADEKLTVTVEGGELLAFGSANPRTEERFDAGSYTTYYGKALAAVRVTEVGTVIVTVSDGKESVSAKIDVQA